MGPARKLTGAQAALFAATCEHYIQAAEDECNDCPNEIPLFSRLSPQQRLKLVSEVMIGVLCEGEPLPPNTIQHNATYRAIIETLFVQLEVENDFQYELDDVRRDLLEYDRPDNSRRMFTQKDQEERNFQNNLIAHRAEKNMKKIKKKEVGEFHVDNVPDRIDSNIEKQVISLFAGGPISVRRRNSIRPLNDDEELAFNWRRLCDAALQEDVSSPLPLSKVNFDWRCHKLDKWYQAINILLDTNMMDYGTLTERALIHGEIDERTYADPTNFPRIQAVEKHVEILRKTYESTWDPKQKSIDQRCIFAVCSKEAYGNPGHQKWIKAFIMNCTKLRIDFRVRGNYQARLNIFRKMKDRFKEGLETKFTGCEFDVENWEPSKFSPDCQGYTNAYCQGPGPFMGCCYKVQNLKACSRCKVVMYCSTECQCAHWPKHKKECTILATERKDKQKIAQMAKKIEGQDL